MTKANSAMRAAAVLLLSACGGKEPQVVAEAAAAEPAATTYVVHDTTVLAQHEITGTAEPYRQATLSTKMMGTVTAVFAEEGARVASGTILAHIDSRDVDAKAAQVRAGIAGAMAAQHEAELMAARMRALYADSAAPKAQLDAAEAGLARANAGVAQARAGEEELAAVASYSAVRAPFAGVVTQRFVDPGAFAAPGAPIVTVQEHSRLRIAASAAPREVKGLRPGTTVDVSVEGAMARGKVEGVVPSAASLLTVNVVVDNRAGQLTPGGAATIRLGEGNVSTRLVPQLALVHEGDLTGVRIKGASGPTIRWVRTGRTFGDFVEVVAGLDVGTVVLVPTRSAEK
ncbi:MAG: efflux RND transporter periplasmic adaptor subunit [Gemmatimonadaceae bacterium]